MKNLLCRAAALSILACFSLAVLADPPPWAPAHGWRKKNDPYYMGYTGKKWDNDYGILDGRCNTAAVGAVLGGAVGGAVGSQVAKGDNRPVAIVIGTVLGAVIGSKIGADVDASDRGCMGHALELAGENRTVSWVNPTTGVTYRLTPTRNFSDQRNPCREFTTVAVAPRGGKHGKGKGRAQNETSVKGVACRPANGEWQVRM